MEENAKTSSPISMIFYIIDNDKKEPSQSWEIIPKKKYILGRSKKESDIVVNEKLLSRKHAELIYYDSKTILIKDLDSRNGTYINKERIEPLKERFFSVNDVLSLGNNNNEILFLDKNEKDKENKESEKVKEKESNGEEINNNINDNYQNNKDKDNNRREIINTDVKKSYDSKLKNRDEEEINNRNSYPQYEQYNNKYKERSISNEKRLRSYPMENERNMETEIKNRNQINYDNIEMKSYERNNDYNYRRSRHGSNKSRSNTKERIYRSRSRDTLQRPRHDSHMRNSRTKEREYNNYNYYDNIDKKREREYEDRIREREYDNRDRDDEYRRREKGLSKANLDRDENDDYIRRKEFERQKMIEEENEEELNYRMKMRAKGKKDRGEYDDRRFDYGPEVKKIDSNLSDSEMHFEKNKEGYIKCQVNGYMFLKIKDIEFLKGNNWKK